MKRRAWAKVILAGIGTSSSGCLSTRGPSVAAQADAPPFRLKSHLGGDVALVDLVKRGPVAIVFYRGHW
jgi:hypothetical protein